MKAVAFSKFAFHAYLLATVVAADSQQIPYQLPVCPLAPHLSRLSVIMTYIHVVFLLHRGWRPTSPTGWTRVAPETRVGSTSTMRTLPSDPGTTAPTDTEPMSTTTTINCGMKLSITKFSTAAFYCITDYILPTYYYRAMFKDSNNSICGGAK